MSQEDAILDELRALRAEILLIREALAEARGADLNGRVATLEDRVSRLERWRALLAGGFMLATSGAIFAWFKLFAAGP